MRRAPEETRERLLAAAKSLFARRGLHGVSVAEIAQAADVSAAMINHHFGGKDALYRACLAGFGEQRLHALDRFLAPCASREEFMLRLELLVNELLDLHLRDPEIVEILLRDVNASEHWGDELEQMLFQFTLRFAQFFELARERGFVRKEVSPVTAAGVIYLSLSAMLQVDSHRERVTGASLKDAAERRAVTKSLLDVVLFGLLPRDGA